MAKRTATRNGGGTLMVGKDAGGSHEDNSYQELPAEGVKHKIRPPNMMQARLNSSGQDY